MKKLQFIIPPILLIVLAIIIFGVVKMRSQSAEPMPSSTATSTTKEAVKMPAPEEKKITENSAMAANNKTSSSTEDSMTDAKLAGSRVDLQSINKLNPGKLTLAFKLYGENTKELQAQDLKMVNEKPMHLILVRDDQTVYQHLYPEYVNGRWTVATQIDQPGNYNLYVDIVPVVEKAVVLRLPIVIGEPTMKKKYPKATPEFTKMVGGVTARADLKSPIKAGEKMVFGIRLTQAGKPVGQLNSAMGVFGEALVLMHAEPEHYEMLNVLTKEKPADGTVKFEAEFPVDGMYTIYATFDIGGHSTTFPITVEVGQAKTGAKDATM